MKCTEGSITQSRRMFSVAPPSATPNYATKATRNSLNNTIASRCWLRSQGIVGGHVGEQAQLRQRHAGARLCEGEPLHQIDIVQLPHPLLRHREPHPAAGQARRGHRHHHPLQEEGLPGDEHPGGPYPHEATRIHEALLDNQLCASRRLEAPDTGMRRGGRLRAMRLLDGGRDGCRVPFLPRDHPRRPRPESRQVIKIKG